MKLKLAGAAIILMAVFAGEAAQAAPERGTLSLLFENDLFYKTDRDYTNGVELSYTFAAQDTPEALNRLARWLPLFSQTGKVRASFALGQSIYTPSSISNVNPSLTQRPYAGFLYGSVGLSDDTGSHLDQLGLQVGVIGPSSLASDTQEFVHSVIGAAQPKGWHTQLRGEPAIVLTYSRNLRILPRQSFLGMSFDFEPHYGVALGNVFDFANIGAMARFGLNIPDDYGPLRIEPSLPGSGFFQSTGLVGAYVFAGVDGRAIGRNLFLDGNSWAPSRSVSKKSLVGDLNFGAAVTFNFMQVTFTHTLRTREYRTQSAPDQFGAINLSFKL